MTSLPRAGVVLAAALTALAPAFAGEWIRQSPYPYPPQNLDAIDFADDARGYAVGAQGVLMETSDGGVTWDERDIGGASYNDVVFADAEHGWLVGNGAEASFRTMDGGATWLPMPALPAGSWFAIQTLSSDFAWANGNGPVAVTDDGGVSWSLAIEDGEWIQAASFATPDLGLGKGASGIWRTTDRGGSWQLVRSASSVVTVRMLSEDLAIATVGASILRSADGGQTWQFAAGAPDTTSSSRAFEALNAIVIQGSDGPGYSRTTDGGQTWSTGSFGVALYDLVVEDANRAHALSVRGDILRTDDAGATWTTVRNGEGFVMWDIAFAGEDTACAVGNGGLVLRTTDGGLSWTFASNGHGSRLSDVAMWNRERGVAVGDFGLVLHTDDGGEHWLPTSIGIPQNLAAVSVLPPAFAFTVGFGPTLSKTFDGGRTWQTVEPPDFQGIGRMNDVHFLTPEMGWAAGGGDAFILFTADGGETWSQQLIGPGTVRGIDFVDENRGWACGFSDVILRTTDGGLTWTDHVIPNPIGVGMTDIEFVNESVGWLVGSFGYVARTTNGGLLWQLQDSGTDAALLAIHPVSETEVWITGELDVLHTTDGGSTWQIVPTGFSPQDAAGFKGLEVTPQNDIWVSGANGTILHRAGAGDPADVNGDGLVDFADLLLVLAAWGECPDCPEDVDGDGFVGFSDLLAVLAAWS